ncbi:AraC family transcriptional regulator [Actinoplanes sp. RD1]|uniref:AraC family transcriptional regulator n=1 Tax=Actinoplanes sp. RD1 TaxID=3064538 RepID=UPI002741B9E7|nr:AraC family transcriptional regulator [Actinoplanes sp. RD1]
MTDVHLRAAAAPAEASIASVDLDDTRYLLRRFFYPLSVGVPEGAHNFRFRFDVIQLGPLTVGQLGFGAPVTLGSGELHAYHLTIPVAGQVRSYQSGNRVLTDVDQAAIFHPDAPVHTLHDRNSCELDVKIEQAALENELSTLLGHRIEGPLDLPAFTDLKSGPMRSWIRMIRLLRGEIRHGGSLVHEPLIAEQLRRSIMNGLLLALPHRYTDALTAPVTPGPSRAVQRAVDAIHDEPERPYTVGEIAEIAGVSVRSLQEGFRRHLDCAPMTYLQQVRLTRAHEALLREDPARTTVAAVAHRWGFAHLGRFASAYRARYGMSPSDTLRNR